KSSFSTKKEKVAKRKKGKSPDGNVENAMKLRFPHSHRAGDERPSDRDDQQRRCGLRPHKINQSV
ncbi:MAG: hypothetical protein ACSLFQ_09590, partial [Thermoanaerobaculia bacterium]